MRTFARSAELSSVYSGWSTSCSRASVRYMRPPRLAEAFVLPGLSRSGRVPGVPTTGATCLLQPGVRGGGEAGVPRCEEPRDAPQPARWRGPESNRRHHDFQSCGVVTGCARFAGNFAGCEVRTTRLSFPYFADFVPTKRPTAARVGLFVALDSHALDFL